MVKGFTARDLENLFQFRCILESAAVEQTIRLASDREIATVSRLAERRVAPGDPEPYLQYSRLNVEFHLALAQLGRNPILVSTLQNVLNQLRRALTLDWKQSDVNVLLQGHSELMEAVAARDLPCLLYTSYQNLRLFGKMSAIENVIIGAQMQPRYRFAECLIHTGNFKRSEQFFRDKALKMMKIMEIDRLSLIHIFS